MARVLIYLPADVESGFLHQQLRSESEFLGERLSRNWGELRKEKDGIWRLKEVEIVENDIVRMWEKVERLSGQVVRFLASIVDFDIHPLPFRYEQVFWVGGAE